MYKVCVQIRTRPCACEAEVEQHDAPFSRVVLAHGRQESSQATHWHARVSKTRLSCITYIDEVNTEAFFREIPLLQPCKLSLNSVTRSQRWRVLHCCPQIRDGLEEHLKRHGNHTTPASTDEETNCATAVAHKCGARLRVLGRHSSSSRMLVIIDDRRKSCVQTKPAQEDCCSCGTR